jgi:hypothetical protein
MSKYQSDSIRPDRLFGAGWDERAKHTATQTVIRTLLGAGLELVQEPKPVGFLKVVGGLPADIRRPALRGGVRLKRRLCRGSSARRLSLPTGTSHGTSVRSCRSRTAVNSPNPRPSLRDDENYVAPGIGLGLPAYPLHSRCGTGEGRRRGKFLRFGGPGVCSLCFIVPYWLVGWGVRRRPTSIGGCRFVAPTIVFSSHPRSGMSFTLRTSGVWVFHLAASLFAAWSRLRGRIAGGGG